MDGSYYFWCGVFAGVPLGACLTFLALLLLYLATERIGQSADELRHVHFKRSDHDE